MKSLPLLTLLALCPATLGRGTDDTTGTIQGKVVFDGKRPAPKPRLTVTEEQTKGCHSHGEMDLEDKTLLISEKGGVANVVLMLEVKGVEREIPSEPVEIDQRGCRFHPHVIVVPVGATLRFANSDETTHNVHTLPRKNKTENKNVAGGGVFEQKLDKEETFPVKCDIHPWMKGYIVVTEATHYAVTDEEGNFSITGVPPGEYTLSWWHEELGKGKTEKVVVEAGKVAEVTQKVGAKKKKKGGRRRR